MIIDDLTIYHISLPLAKPFRISVGEIRDKEFVLVRGRSGDQVGWGEAAVDGIPFYTSETAGTALHIIQRVLGPLVLSKDWESVDELVESMDAFRGHAFAKMAVETMFWDLLGKKTGQSVARMLQPDADKIPTHVEMGTSIGIKKSPDELLREVEAHCERGVRRIKVKVCPGYDYDYLEAVRRHFPSITLMADANCAYSPDQMDELARWDEFGLIMIEQPFDHDDIYFHSLLRQKMRTPICLDESLPTLHLVQCAIELNAADIVNIKVGRVGGLLNTVRVHDACRDAEIPVWIGSRIGAGVADSARVAAAALPNAIFPTDACVSSHYLDCDLLREPLVIKDGCMVEVPQGPGLGIQVDEDEVAKYTIAKHTV